MAPPPPQQLDALSSGHEPGSTHAATGGLGAPAARRSRMPEHNAAAAAALPGAALPSARCAQDGTVAPPCGGAASWPAARGEAVALAGTEAGLEAGLLPPCAPPPCALPPCALPPCAPSPLTAPSAAPVGAGRR